MRFADRQEAGKLLAVRLPQLRYETPIVLALPRGGVPVGFEIARALGAPLDLVLVRKIPVPFEEELALGAIADGATPEWVIDQGLKNRLNIPQDYIDQAREDALREIARRRQVYLGNRPPLEIAGKTAILADDGIATGATMQAALRATRRQRPARLVLAVPVAPAAAVRHLAGDADETVCLHTPQHFQCVGQFYRSFPQLRDDEVTGFLELARRNLANAASGRAGVSPASQLDRDQ
jgi:putative phosphoribosyl transferase